MQLRLHLCLVSSSLLAAARPIDQRGVSLLQERAHRHRHLPALHEGGWNDTNIIFDDGKWWQIPEPFFQPGAPRPHAQQLDLLDTSVRSSVKIVVLAAALREPRTVHTLESLFSTAAHPSRVYVGVVQQNSPEDEDALEGLCQRLGTPLERLPGFAHRRTPGEDEWGQGRFTAKSLAACEPASRVRIFRMDTSESAGPVYARAQQRRLLSKGSDMEDFCLQIDAHAVFTRNWDEQLLKEFAATENEYAVLTTYPTDAATMLADGSFPNANGHWEMPHICGAKIIGRGVVRNDQASAAANLKSPALSKFWAAGLSFSRCHAERDVPSDPHLRQVFNGEEFSRGARLWTSGYDFYSLARPVLGVYYGAEKGGKGGWHMDSSEMAASEDRLEQLLCRGNVTAGAPSSLLGFDLGARRRFQDYRHLTGVDPVRHKSKKTSCMVRQWTPWLPGAQPPYEPLRGAPAPMEPETPLQSHI